MSDSRLAWSCSCTAYVDVGIHYCFLLQVFVAGSTGRIGLRIVRQLLLAGFKVRAGARNLDKAQNYANLAEEFGIVGSDAIKRLQIVPVDLEDTSTIVSAIGNAGRVRHLFYECFIFCLQASLSLSNAK